MPAERYRRHGHYPALILVEDNPEFARQVERALFADQFEVLHLSSDAVPASDFQTQYAAFESAGLVVIYSYDSIPPEVEKKLVAAVGYQFFHVTRPDLSSEPANTVGEIVARLKSLRALQGFGGREKTS